MWGRAGLTGSCHWRSWMTRLLIAGLAAYAVSLPTSLFAQNFAAPGAAVRGAAPTGPQPAMQQPARPVVQQGGPYPVRPVAAQQPGVAGPAGAIPAGSPAGPPAAVPAMPVQPAWAAQMTPEEKKWIDDVLTFWEKRSENTALFECKFQRWDYDPTFGPADRTKAKTYAEGIIKYAKPDKGLYRVEKLSSYVAPAKLGDKEYFEQDASFGEHWVCDGQRIFEFDARNKRLIERALPPEMRNKAIADGPLPFMFGAKAATIKGRYWIHGLPQSGNGKYWLEAVPNQRQDAQNFSRVIIVLDQNDFLPETLQVFAPNFDERTNPAKQTYAFKERKTPDPKNFLQVVGDKLNPLSGFFKADDFNPKPPAGWKKVVENDLAAIPAAPAGPQPQAQPRQPPPLPR